MAQTVGQTSFRNAVIEYSTNGTSWVDMSGVSNKIDPSGGDRAQGEEFTGDADTAVITIGKREPIKIGIDIVYSEATTDHFVNMETYHQSGTALKIRWAPKGSATGNFRYTTDTGYITSFTPPAGEYGSGDPILVSLELTAAYYGRAAIS